jgi:tetratricopeptide (TPR) repeat protein
MAGEPNEGGAGVNIGGGQVSVGGSIAGRDVIIYEAAVPRIAALHQLPQPPGDFTGREAELSELHEAILQGGAHISGLQGQGGVGKTTLALKLAARLAPQFPDAQIHLDLKGASEKPLSAGEALAHVVRSFHPEAKLPEKEEELKPLFTSVLYGKRALLLMDNARDAAQVLPLIPPDGSTLLVTSRSAFTLPGLKQKRLDTLPPKDANDLLLKIAPRIDSAAEVIAKSCGYLALALRLAATAIAEHADLDPAEYAKKLADESRRLSLLPGAAGDPSVEASIANGYNLLDMEMQKHWRMLGSFPDTFDSFAAAAVWEMEPGVAQERLSRLLQLSMLEFDETAKRYRLHDLMRDFARRKVSGAEGNVAAQQHARHYERVLSNANFLYTRGDLYAGNTLIGSSALAMRGLALFDLERVNIQAGHEWAKSHAENDREAARLCSNYPRWAASVLNLRLHPREMIQWLEAALRAACTLSDREAESVHVGNLGVTYNSEGDYPRAVEFLERSLMNTRELGDRRGEGQTLGGLGVAYYGLREYHRAIDYYEKALAIVGEGGDQGSKGETLGNLGLVYYMLGEYRRAFEYHEKALDVLIDFGDPIGKGRGFWHLSYDLYKLGEHKEAVAKAEAALAIFEQIESPYAAQVRTALEVWRREAKA